VVLVHGDRGDDADHSDQPRQRRWPAPPPPVPDYPGQPGDHDEPEYESGEVHRLLVQVQEVRVRLHRMGVTGRVAIPAEMPNLARAEHRDFGHLGEMQGTEAQGPVLGQEREDDIAGYRSHVGGGLGPDRR